MSNKFETYDFKGLVLIYLLENRLPVLQTLTGHKQTS